MEGLFEAGRLGVRLLEGVILTHLDVLLHVLLAVDIVNANAVHAQAVACGGKADDLKHRLIVALHRIEVDHDVGTGHDIVHLFLHRCCDIVGLLQRGVPCDHHGDIGKGVRSAAPGAHAPRPQHPRDHDRLTDLRSKLRRDGIEQGADRPLAELKADMDHDAGDDEGGCGIGPGQPGDAGSLREHHQEQPNEHNSRGPDIGRKVERISLERLAVVFFGCTRKGARAAEIDDDREDDHRKGPEADLDMHLREEQASD
ncbi:MAG: hypothetical protein BWY77_01881 [bacterium ADurb.Bin431]|nr:MAG: hypothetical protein BWY77_01881 [bacterium ADurb.Bin431]